MFDFSESNEAYNRLSRLYDVACECIEALNGELGKAQERINALKARNAYLEQRLEDLDDRPDE